MLKNTIMQRRGIRPERNATRARDTRDAAPAASPACAFLRTSRSTALHIHTCTIPRGLRAA
eukprot:202192-Prymnesium_polylepis.1